MDSKIISGKEIAKKREEKLKEKVSQLKFKPKVVSILIGDDPPSVLYTNMKQKKASEVGIDFQPIKLSEDTAFYSVMQLIIQLNEDPTVSGIMIQLPLPKKFLGTHKTQELLQLINPKKDIDGLTKNSPFLTAAVAAVFGILEEENIEIKGKYAVIVGASELIGLPIADELKNRGAMVRVCDSRTENLSKYTRQADILISATGVPNLIKADMIKEGVVVLDVGVMVLSEPIEKDSDLPIVGDVDFESVVNKASKITPVPGGVGPVTVISLMENAVKSVSS